MQPFGGEGGSGYQEGGGCFAKKGKGGKGKPGGGGGGGRGGRKGGGGKRGGQGRGRGQRGGQQSEAYGAGEEGDISKSGVEADEVKKVLSRPNDGDQSKPTSAYIVGTCGFMSVQPRVYAGLHEAVELNCTYHDRGSQSYDAQAVTYARIGLKVIVKVSGYATHDVGIAEPSEWWPWLRSKYAAFLDRGILLALLWQFPPSFRRTEETLRRLDALGAMLRSPGQGQSPQWVALDHAFEFRDMSWFGDPGVADVMQRHSLTLVRLHVVNDTGWAGNLDTGWHGGPFEGSRMPPDFAYLRCFGSHGRSIGKYERLALYDMAEQMRGTRRAVAMFGQGDVPPHAFESAAELQDILAGGLCLSGPQRWLEEASVATEDVVPPKIVSGTVIAISRDYEQSVIFDVGGRRGYLGKRHSRKRGLQFKIGNVIENLHVEGELDGWLVLSVRGGPDVSHE
eukprot:TRINITY_DN17665_c0_g1_i4.p1 TRINITY_DN17665_c0_g1~~TRINITY_DN17665_c0_g1_i4.p1  ORF type:complete len:451 (-),score=73.19 TRINITY_DN17665_c0_g1_i4:20-1372(-)